MPPPCQPANSQYTLNAMPDTETISQSLERAFPGAQVAAVDSTGEGDHFAVTIVSQEFVGKSLVERHQMVYRALGAIMQHVHALQIRAATPNEQ